MPFYSRRTRDKQQRRQPHIEQDERHIFQRSRTLTGSVSSTIIASNELNSQLKSSRLKAHDLKKIRKFMIVGVLAASAAAGLFIWLLDQLIVSLPLQSSLTLSEQSKHGYENAANEYFSTRPMERFSFMLNSTQFSDYMAQKFPEVESAQTQNVSGLASYGLRINFRQAVVKWRIGDDVFYVDAAGEAYKINHYQIEPSVAVKDNSGLPVASQQLVASTRLLKFIGQTISLMNKQQVGTVKEVIIPPATLKAIDIVLDSQSYRIKMNTDREVEGQVLDAVHAVRFLQQHSISPPYVDVRVAGKAFYLE